MPMNGLPQAIDAARKRLGMSVQEYAELVGLSREALRKILAGGGVHGSTLARLRRVGGIRVTGRLIDSLDTV